jgi:hypothetical protein
MNKKVIALVVTSAFLPCLSIRSNAGSLDQLGMYPIYKDATHTVYFSEKWLLGKWMARYSDEGTEISEASLLMSYNVAGNHSGFADNSTYLSSETQLSVDCKDRQLAFRGDATYEGRRATGKKLNSHFRTVGPDHDDLEFNEASTDEDKAIVAHVCGARK